MKLPEIRLVIFDCDGVLVDSEDLAIKALVEELKTVGIEMTEADFPSETFRGAGMKNVLSRIEERSGKRLPEGFEQSYRKRASELFTRELRAVEGVSEAIDEIGIEFCVASSGPMEKIKRSLQITGLAKRFGDRIFSAYDIGRFKPEPDLFLHAAAQMGVEPEHCLVVEDSVLGVQAARAAGMKVLGFAPFSDDGSLERAGAKVFTRMQELPRLVQATRRF